MKTILFLLIVSLSFISTQSFAEGCVPGPLIDCVGPTTTPPAPSPAPAVAIPICGTGVYLPSIQVLYFNVVVIGSDGGSAYETSQYIEPRDAETAQQFINQMRENGHSDEWMAGVMGTPLDYNDGASWSDSDGPADDIAFDALEYFLEELPYEDTTEEPTYDV